MKNLMIVAIVLLIFLAISGCGKKFKVMPISQGQPCPFAGVIVSLDQLVDANDPAPMDGLLIGGKKVENALGDLADVQ